MQVFTPFILFKHFGSSCSLVGYDVTPGYGNLLPFFSSEPLKLHQLGRWSLHCALWNWLALFITCQSGWSTFFRTVWESVRWYLAKLECTIVCLLLRRDICLVTLQSPETVVLLADSLNSTQDFWWSVRVTFRVLVTYVTKASFLCMLSSSKAPFLGNFKTSSI